MTKEERRSAVTCPKCFKIHGELGEARETCIWCRHLYPTNLFERSYRGGMLCVYCDDKRAELEQDAKQDLAWEYRDPDDADEREGD
jgi:hypothetical protein